MGAMSEHKGRAKEERTLTAQRLARLARQQPVLSFFLLAYLLSWLLWWPMAATGESRPLLALGSFGPTVAALLLTGLMEGRAGLQRLLRSLFIWRVHPGWYLFGFFGTAAVALAAIGIHLALGGSGLIWNDPRQLYLVIPVFLYVLLFSVLGEEIGWRGYALPRLQATQSALAASIILGVVWSLWHLPLFWVPGNFHQTIPLSLFLLQSVGLTVLYTWMYNNTQGSLLLAHLFHAASNTTLGVLPVLPIDAGGSLRPLWLSVAILWLAVIAVTAHAGPQRLAHAKTASPSA